MLSPGQSHLDQQDMEHDIIKILKIKPVDTALYTKFINIICIERVVWHCLILLIQNYSK
jgi:hypothetical protein